MTKNLSLVDLAVVHGGACRVFNWAKESTITPAGGQPVTVPAGNYAFPGTAEVPSGQFGLSVGGTQFKDRQGNPSSYRCENQVLSIVPGPGGAGLFGAR